jgi:phospholipase D1/2
MGEKDSATGSRPSSNQDGGKLLVPGRNCWRIERANRLAVIVDAADYFAAVKSSIEKAQRTVLLIGWDFDTRIRLDPDQRKTTSPDKLGKFLTWVVEQRPELEVYMLKWDLGVIDSLGRGSTPLVVLDWMTDRRMHFKLDHAHPPASAHHQKIVVIDDSLAYCGGIDITADRWDTREHLDEDPHRRRPTTHRKFDPWHDATTAVDGGVALALGELARQRWKRATGEDLTPPSPVGDPWPDDVRPTFEDVDVAIARTLPQHKEQKEVRDIEGAVPVAIGRARRSVYIEASISLPADCRGDCGAAGEPDGPEFVISIGILDRMAGGSCDGRLPRRVCCI